jgi:hypothetical protein
MHELEVLKLFIFLLQNIKGLFINNVMRGENTHNFSLNINIIMS